MSISLLLGWGLVWRSGYSPDEEITMFAVRGILTHGVPVLPSDVVYWRGAPYSYAAAAAATVGGETLQTYRAISVVAGVVTVLTVAATSRVVFGSGATAALLFAVWPAAVAITGYARFYALFVAVYTLTVYFFARAAFGPASPWWFIAGAVVARTLHDFGVSLVLLPIACALSASGQRERRRFMLWTISSAGALGLTHAALMLADMPGEPPSGRWGFTSFGLPSFAFTAFPIVQIARPSDVVCIVAVLVALGAAMRHAVATDIVLMLLCAVAASVFALGGVIALAVTFALAQPTRVVHIVVTTLVTLTVGWAAWLTIVVVRTDAALTWTVARDLVFRSLSYTWDGPRLFAMQLPILTLATSCGVACAMRVEGAHGLSRTVVRGLALVLWLQVVSIGVFDIDLRMRYLAVMTPLLAMFAGYLLFSLISHARRGATAQRVGLIFFACLVISLMVDEQQRMASAQTERATSSTWWRRWAPPVSQASLDSDRAPTVDPNDIVITNDELACLLRLGRVDYWWPSDDTALARFSFSGPSGVRRGVYGGGEVLTGLFALERLVENRGARGVSIVLFNTGKFGFTPAALSAISSSPSADTWSSEDWSHIRVKGASP